MSSLFVFDGMNRPSFTIEIDVEHATVADLFYAVADSYALELNGRRNLRIIFADKELKYTRRKKLHDVGIIKHSTIAVIFRLPDRHPTAPATATEDADVAESEPVKTEDDDAKEGKLIADEESKDVREVKAYEESKDVREVKAYEENKDVREVKADEESKVAMEVNADEGNKDAREVKANEEKKYVNEVSVAESEPVKTDDDDAKEERLKTIEGNKDTKEVNADEENTDVSEVKAGEENKDAKEVKADEENKCVSEVSVPESEPVKTDDDAKYAKKVKTTEDPRVANEISDAIKTEEASPILDGAAIESSSSGGVEMEENRPVLQRLPGVVELAFLPDMILNFDFNEERAILPCFHVMGSETMRDYCQKQVDTGNTKFDCPHRIPVPFLPQWPPCPVVWNYRLVRHVACFTTKEMHSIEKAIAINFIGKDSTTLTCPRCFSWCSKAEPNMTRLRCFLCTRESGKEFFFCSYCLGEWKNARSGKCTNPECKSIEKTLDILRNSPVTSLYGGTWPTLRLCPRCGILTEFMGLCSQVHCQLCGYDYCFLCLKGANSKEQLQCVPYESSCQRASLQTSIPDWDGHNSD